MDKKIFILIGILIVLSFVSLSLSGNLVLNKSDDFSKEYKVGVIAPFTGPLSSFGNSIKKGILDAEKDINSNNLKIIFEDDSADGKKALNAAKKLVEIDNVDIIFNFSSSSSQAITPYLKDKNISQFSVTMDSLLTKKSNNLFIIYPTNYYEAQTISNFLISKNANNIGIVYSNVQTHVDEINFLKSDLNITYIDKIEMNQDDTKSLVTKLKNQDLDYLVVLFYPKHLNNFLDEIKKQDYDVNLVGNLNFNSVNKDLSENINYVSLPIYNNENSLLDNKLNNLNSIEKIDKYLFSYSYDNLYIIYDFLKNNQSKNYLLNKKYNLLSGEINITDDRLLKPELYIK